jgi:Domain of Unknown Function (DUF350)
MDAAPGSFAAIIDALGSGLPKLIIQFITCAVLLAIGVIIYTRLTPFREREMVVHGNAAAGTMLAGAILALAIPLAAMLATSGTRRRRSGDAQLSCHDRGWQYRRRDHLGGGTDRCRVAECGGDGASMS